MKQTIKIQVGENIYAITLIRVRGGHSYELKRNKIVKSVGYSPICLKSDIKMFLVGKMIRYATYDIEHELEKLTVK